MSHRGLLRQRYSDQSQTSSLPASTGSYNSIDLPMVRGQGPLGAIDIGRRDQVEALLAGIAATVAAPVIGGAASITISGSRQLAYLVETITADTTPPERITELVKMTTVMSVLGHLATTPAVHQGLHLATVEPELCNEIAHHVETFSAATTSVEKARSFGDVMQMSSQSVDLTSFTNRLNVLIGG